MKFPKKTELPEKKHEESIPSPWPTPLYKQSIMSMIWNISTGQPGLTLWLCSLPAPAHLLSS